jgi:hypothetical protein
MQFDTKSPTPKVLFSPVSAVPQEDLEVLQRQAKSAAAESAVKLTVYQVDSSGQEEDNTEFVSTETESKVSVEASTDSVDVAIEEPVLRESNTAQADKPKDVSNIVNKWAKK